MFRLHIDKVVSLGYGICFLDGKTFFVSNSFPGDVLDVEILYKKKNLYFCEIISVVSPSKYRSEIRCELSNKCGACDWINVDYDKQIELKEAIYNEVFRDYLSKKQQKNDKLGKQASLLKQICIALPFSKSMQIDYYRNKCTFPVQEVDKDVKIGMYKRQTHIVIEHQHCFLYPEVYKKILVTIKEWMIKANIKPYNESSNKGNVRYVCIRSSHDLKSILVVLITKKKKLDFTNQLVRELITKYQSIRGIIQNINPYPNNVNMGENDIILFGNNFLIDNLADLKLKFHYKAFYQVNVLQTKAIYQELINHLDQDQVVVDAYCGVGCIGLLAAKKVKKVICIEENKAAFLSALENASSNDIENIEFINDVVENVLEKLTDSNKIDTIIFDPPRKGLDKNIINCITTDKIIYLSCNPITQKRDILLLISKGYRLLFLKAYDMFPHTWHIESMAVLEKI